MLKRRVRGTWPTLLTEVFTVSGGPRSKRWGYCSIETPQQALEQLREKRSMGNQGNEVRKQEKHTVTHSLDNQRAHEKAHSVPNT